MSKNKILLVINPLMGLLVLWQIITGLNADKLGRLFDTLHVIPGIILGILAIIHTALNWPWVRSNYLKGSGQRKIQQ